MWVFGVIEWMNVGWLFGVFICLGTIALIFVLLFIVAFSLGLGNGLNWVLNCKNCHFCHFIIDCDFLCINKTSKLFKMWHFWFILWVSTGLDKGNSAVQLFIYYIYSCSSLASIPLIGTAFQSIANQNAGLDPIIHIVCSVGGALYRIKVSMLIFVLFSCQSQPGWSPAHADSWVVN